VKLSLTSAAKLRQAEATMNFRGHKKKRKKFQANADVDLACSQHKINLQAGSELCIASLQGLSYLLVKFIISNMIFNAHFITHVFIVVCIILFYVWDRCSFVTSLKYTGLVSTK